MVEYGEETSVVCNVLRCFKILFIYPPTLENLKHEFLNLKIIYFRLLCFLLNGYLVVSCLNIM